MPNRYWVGGTASWDTTDGTKWSETSGGVGGATRPTTADDVFFDANSTGIVTLAITGDVKSINFTGFTGTFTGTSGLRIFGSPGGDVTLSSAMTYSHTGSIVFIGSGTLITAGKTLNAPLTISGGGQSNQIVTLGDALLGASNRTISLTGGTFDTAGYSVTFGSMDSSVATTGRAFNFGSSTITLTGSGNAINLNTNLLTVNSGTSNIIVAGNGASINVTPSGGVTFNNVTYNPGGTAVSAMQVSSPVTFNNFTIEAPTSGTRPVSFLAPCTFNGGIFSANSTPSRRVEFRTNIPLGAGMPLTVNGAYDITNADFRDIHVYGTSAPLTGDRISNLGNNRGISFPDPKTVYWVGTSGGDWIGNFWASTSGGVADVNNFPLAQDIAVFDNAVNISSSVLINQNTKVGTLDTSARTNSLSFNISQVHTIYGDLILGSGVNTSGGNTTTFSGRKLQTITSNGRKWNNNITITSPNGILILADALNIGSGTLTVDQGELDTGGYAMTIGALSSGNSNYRIIKLRNSTITTSSSNAINLSGGVLLFDAGTSLFNMSGVGTLTLGDYTFYDLAFITTTGGYFSLGGNGWSCRNLSLRAYQTGGSTGYGVMPYILSGDFTITGELTTTSLYNSPAFRIALYSNTVGTQRTISVGSFTGNHIDFSDINIVGVAAPISGPSLGDAGNNSGIAFPSPKTVYWNLGGSVNFALGWATTSGGSPSVENFPLAQDTAIWDNTGSAGTITISSVVWRLPNLDFSARTTTMNFTVSNGPCEMYGDLILSPSVTYSFGSTWTFKKRGLAYLNVNGASGGPPLTIDAPNGTLQLASAFTTQNGGLGGAINLNRGTFDAASYNVTITSFTSTSGVRRTLRMGSGTWTLMSSGTMWNVSVTEFILNKGTSTILLANNTTTARNFTGGNLDYNKLIIGGDTSTSTLTINGGNFFGEIDSTKTVAHTITLNNTPVFGKWSVSGSAGNVVTVGGGMTINGPCVSGVDYLSLGSSSVNNAEFYAGANSTGTGTNVYLTTKPADSVRYWVGGTGNWSDTSKWSTSSGGAGGASIPRSHDDVIFNSNSHTTSYTVTVNVTAFCKSLTFGAPASGSVTWAGSSATMLIFGSMTLPATGLTRSFSGQLIFNGSLTNNIVTTNGVQLASTVTFLGHDGEWSLGSTFITNGNSITVARGTFRTQNYNLTCTSFDHVQSTNTLSSKIYLGSSSFTLIGSGSPIVSRGISESFIFDTGTSTITPSSSSLNFGSSSSRNTIAFYNMVIPSAVTSITWFGNNCTFNDVTFEPRTSEGISTLTLNGDFTVNGTLTFQTPTAASRRWRILASASPDTIQRTITANAFSGSDVDFLDIVFAGSASPISGTRLGDLKGNSGITFSAPKTVYWNSGQSSATWGTTAWATSSGGTIAAENFPLAQDTAIVDNSSNAGGNFTIVLNEDYAIGTFDVSQKTVGVLTLSGSGGSNGQLAITGNWSNNPTMALTMTAGLRFLGRTSQTLTSAGKTFTGYVYVDSPDGTLTLQDSLIVNFSSSASIAVIKGSFNSNGYNVTTLGPSSGIFTSYSYVRSINIGSGTWTINGTGGWNSSTAANLTVTGTGTIKMNSPSNESFSGGGVNMSTVTLDISNAGQVTMGGNNIFKNISNSYSSVGSSTLNIGTSIIRVSDFTATGEATRPFILNGSSLSNLGRLVFTGTSRIDDIDYLTITGVQAIPFVRTWYAGANSTGSGIEGFIFEDAPPPPPPAEGMFFMFI